MPSGSMSKSISQYQYLTAPLTTLKCTHAGNGMSNATRCHHLTFFTAIRLLRSVLVLESLVPLIHMVQLQEQLQVS